MQIQSAVITGATGAIGTALISELCNHGIRVLVLTRADSPRNDVIPKRPLVKVQYCALSELADFESDEGYDVFFHFAWQGTTGAGRNDSDLQNENIRYALDVVRLAKRMGCHSFIGVGSQAEYGRTEEIMRPETPCNPETAYGKAKYKAGIECAALCRELSLRFIWTRVLSVYGPNDGAQSMIMSTIRKLQCGERPIFSEGTQMWDYLYSGDAAKAFYLLSEKGVDGKTYVLSSGEHKPLKEYIYTLRDVVSPGTDLGFGEYPMEGKPVSIRGDISALTADTGFIPETDFKTGIQSILKK